MNNILKDIPKIELHCHLDGSVRAETMYELLNASNKIKGESFEEFKEKVKVEKECKSLIEYLEKFEYPLLVMQNEENIERIAYELLEDLHKQNVKYVEIRFAPYLSMEKGLSFDQVVKSVINGMKRAKKDYGIMSNIILICMRHESLERSMSVVNLGEKYLGKGVVAVDLAGNEADFPPEIHQESFELAYKKGYNITVHAGETGNYENIIKSIQLLHAERIGHGIAAINDTKTMEIIKENNVFLEMCPISNLQTKAVEDIKAYPIKDFINRGINVTVNTDNVTVSNTSLEKEYKFLMNELDFNIEDIVKLIHTSIDATFLSKSEKINLRDIINKELKELNIFHN